MSDDLATSVPNPAATRGRPTLSRWQMDSATVTALWPALTTLSGDFTLTVTAPDAGLVIIEGDARNGSGAEDRDGYVVALLDGAVLGDSNTPPAGWDPDQEGWGTIKFRMPAGFAFHVSAIFPIELSVGAHTFAVKGAQRVSAKTWSMGSGDRPLLVAFYGFSALGVTWARGAQERPTP